MALSGCRVALRAFLLVNSANGTEASAVLQCAPKSNSTLNRVNGRSRVIQISRGTTQKLAGIHITLLSTATGAESRGK